MSHYHVRDAGTPGRTACVDPKCDDAGGQRWSDEMRQKWGDYMNKLNAEAFNLNITQHVPTKQYKASEVRFSIAGVAVQPYEHHYKTGADFETDDEPWIDHGAWDPDEPIAATLARKATVRDMVPSVAERRDIRNTGGSLTWQARANAIGPDEVMELLCQLGEILDGATAAGGNDDGPEKCYWCGNRRTKKAPCPHCGRR